MNDLRNLLHEAAELAPATLERELRRPFPVRSTLAAAAAVVLVAGVAAAVSDGTDHRRTSPPATEAPATPKSRAQAAVDSLIDDVVVPADAVQTAPPAAPHLLRGTAYADEEHAVYASRSWVTSLSVEDTMAFLRQHEPPGLADGGSIDSRGPGYAVTGLSGGDSRGALEISVESRPDGRTGIRADARSLWRPDRPDDELLGQVSSVTITVSRGIPSHVEGTASLTGQEAQHLAVLVDTAAVSVGGGGCVADMGQAATLVFTRSSGTVTVHVRPACFAMAYDDGHPHPGLDLPPAVTAAILHAVGRRDF